MLLSAPSSRGCLHLCSGQATLFTPVIEMDLFFTTRLQRQLCAVKKRYDCMLATVASALGLLTFPIFILFSLFFSPLYARSPQFSISGALKYIKLLLNSFPALFALLAFLSSLAVKNLFNLSHDPAIKASSALSCHTHCRVSEYRPKTFT